jgi:putative DNA primase/helicase
MSKPTAKAPEHAVVKQLIEQMRDGTSIFQKPWTSDGAPIGLPMNPISGNRYHGANVLHLMALGHEDCRYVTYKQAKDAGWQVRRGERSTTIKFTTYDKTIEQPDGSKLKVKLDTPMSMYSGVFNASQIDGMPTWEPPVQVWDPCERAEALLAASGVQIEHRAGDAAFYSVQNDMIVLPKPGQFNLAENYYATALHELGHASSSPARLNRPISGTFASIEYAKEELRAEISSLLVGAELGLGFQLGSHAAYIKSWIQILEDQPAELYKAAADAEKICTWVMQFDPERQIQQEQKAAKAATAEAIRAPHRARGHQPATERQAEMSR